MRVISFFTVSILFAMNIFSQSRTVDRMPVAAGRFYSAGKESLTKDLTQFFSSCAKTEVAGKVRAIITPHAGYVYSGSIAASAFSSIPKNTVFKNIFLIGSSHVMAFEGASVYNSGDYITPLGKMKVNIGIANQLKNSSNNFRFPTDAHVQEHSLEVQIPFIQYYFTTQPQIIPVIIGTNNKNTIKSIAEALKPWFTDENLFVISSDFSHYPPYKEAVEADNLTADAIVSKKADIFLNTLSSNTSKSISGLATSMCGWTSGLTLLYLVNNNPALEFKKIIYCNSGDSPYGNKDEVVGYHAIVLSEPESGIDSKNQSAELSFTKAEAEQLFTIARSSIRKMLFENRRQTPGTETIPPNLKVNMGAFVTLKIDGKLRGCIGRFISSDPLYEVVNQMAVASAFDDSRFSPLSKDEFEKVEIEISVIGPLKKINNISEIVLGKHGIYIKRDFRGGTMLPQVATENNWTLEQFLGYTSRDKAGLGWDGWKDAEILIYETVVLEEKKK